MTTLILLLCGCFKQKKLPKEEERCREKEETERKKHTIKGTNVRRVVCKLPNCQPLISKRNLSISVASLFLGFLSENNANAAILEADDDLELLEKVKQDRKKRIEKRQRLEYLQDVIYKLSKVGQAIENNDLPSRSFSPWSNHWLKKANATLTGPNSFPSK
ncbi:thylakoid lumenal 16.5 kDa protein, chloroplastic, partial [Tanacetum coccineum]